MAQVYRWYRMVQIWVGAILEFSHNRTKNAVQGLLEARRTLHLFPKTRVKNCSPKAGKSLRWPSSVLIVLVNSLLIIYYKYSKQPMPYCCKFIMKTRKLLHSQIANGFIWTVWQGTNCHNLNGPLLPEERTGQPWLSFVGAAVLNGSIWFILDTSHHKRNVHNVIIWLITASHATQLAAELTAQTDLGGELASSHKSNRATSTVVQLVLWEPSNCLSSLMCNFENGGFCLFPWSYSSETCLYCLTWIYHIIINECRKNRNIWRPSKALSCILGCDFGPRNSKIGHKVRRTFNS